VDFAESTEQRALRPAVAEIARDFGPPRLTRIAPVNREMILNFVAQHSLGLPRSY
jgi:hypothetical protein